MSKYSTQVRFICESYAGLIESTGYDKVDEVIESARSKVFDFNYPIFDEAYRSVLETKILKHFYTKEIGGETVGLWKLWLNTRLNEIMPYYNQLYKSELLEFNPMYNVDYNRTQKVTKNGTKEDTGETTENSTGTRNTEGLGITTGNATNSEYNYYSDTPQGGVQNLDDYSYLTNARKITNSGQNSNENEYNEDVTNTNQNAGTSKMKSVINNTDDYLEHIQGKQGGESYSKILTDYRATFLNIDMQVINELNDLFINLW